MTVVRRLAALSLVAAFRAAPAIAAWPNYGPPALVDSLAVSPVDGAVYAGTAEGLYRSLAHGRTWSRIGPDLTINHVPETLAVDSANTLFVVLARDGGVFKSSDGGQTLVQLPNGLPRACYERSHVAIAPLQPSTIYLARCGIFRSRDAGASWTQVPFSGAVSVLAVHPRDPRRVLAGTDSVWISDDGGDTWRAAAFERCNIVLDLQFDPSNPARVLSAVWGTYEVARSEDGGESWVRSSDGYFGYGASALAIDPQDPKTTYVTTHGIGAFPPELPYPPGPYPTGVNRSTDGGLSWRSLEGSPSSADLLATDPTGKWIYAASWGAPGVSAYEARPERSPVIRPAPRDRSPRPVERTPVQSAEAR
ncbi:MAG: hypothetical protein M3167_03430 [Acidobacteriota bacterium]|nr:hypothetical protein [Acidobacteriota bacterium]